MVNSDAPKGEFMLHSGGVTLAKNPVIRFVVICKTHYDESPLTSNH
jgi:hypothetical protein